MSNEGKWIHSLSDDVFHSTDFFDTKEEAVRAGMDEYGEYLKLTFFVGQVRDLSLTPSVEAEGILESVNETMYEEVGEVAEDYLIKLPQEQIDELQVELNKALHAWMDKHNNKPTFYKVDNIEQITHLVHASGEVE